MLRIIFFIVLSLFITPRSVMAIVDPLSVPNNKLGIHILFPSELSIASTLVNPQDAGSWGYVVIPIQSGDRDQLKWQTFLDQAHIQKIIPILRIATYPQGSNWASPNTYDLIDFANFLDQLNWHLHNRYIVIFNEVNRSDEYGGMVAPESYADMLAQAYQIFKSKSDRFFILPSALDNAAIDTSHSLHHRTYINRMYRHNPNIFDFMDGWNSHAYPNPDFSAPPRQSGSNKIDSYRTDLKLIATYTDRRLPVFITEAGWSSHRLSEATVSQYMDYAMTNIWTDDNIVTVVPFLLSAQDGAFVHFSFLDSSHQIKPRGLIFQKFATHGQPTLSPAVLSEQAIQSDDFTSQSDSSPQTDYLSRFYTAINMILSLFSR
jgi:hypothetical protein